MKCNYCGFDAHPSVVNEDGSIMCANCFNATKTCAMCVHGNSCEFETNPDPTPKQVQQTIRQGNMTLQAIVKNPSRIETFCAGGCPCFNPEFGCLKENGTCEKYTERNITYDFVDHIAD